MIAGTAELPNWLFSTLPANAVRRATQRPRPTLCDGLPTTFRQLAAALNGVKALAEYEPAANAASAAFWPHLDALLESADENTRMDVLDFAVDHLVPEAAGRVARRLAKDPSTKVREKVRKVVESCAFREVALPATKDGPWDATGWPGHREST